MLIECLDLALQAPTGSNAQGWQWVFVEDPEKKKALADIYRGQRDAVSQSAGAGARRHPRRADGRGVANSAMYLNENMEKAPVLMIPCLEGRPDGYDAGMQASYWGSLLPAVWSFMLALRSRGLGSG